jgi:hypothetical protein
MHFGPLWYAFEHKNCLFITLYSDEGNPETGEKTFRDPENQRMSPEQFAWLKSMLEMGADKEHIFLSLHHPRWLKGGYGDDWDKVHAELVRAGNVSAVFAGHIHRMRYDPKDGIDYVDARDGGGAPGRGGPRGGDAAPLQHRDGAQDQVAHASVPVGEMMDVREITGEMAEQAARLSRTAPEFDRPVPIGMDGAADEVVTVTLTNPTDWEVDLTLVPDSGDSRWTRGPTTNHGTHRGGRRARRSPSAWRGSRTRSTRPSARSRSRCTWTCCCPGTGTRSPSPATRCRSTRAWRRSPSPRTSRCSTSTAHDDVLVVASDAFDLPDGPLTVEAWIRPEGFSGRTGLLAKTESSEYGIFVTDGKPHFAVHLNGSYAVAQSTEPILKVGEWQHIAGVFDGREVRLYLDGRLIEATPASGARTPNTSR